MWCQSQECAIFVSWNRRRTTSGINTHNASRNAAALRGSHTCSATTGALDDASCCDADVDAKGRALLGLALPFESRVAYASFSALPTAAVAWLAAEAVAAVAAPATWCCCWCCFSKTDLAASSAKRLMLITNESRLCYPLNATGWHGS